MLRWRLKKNQTAFDLDYVGGDFVNDDGFDNPRTFSVDIGAEYSGRYVVVFFSGTRNSGTPTITSVTVGGTSLTNSFAASESGSRCEFRWGLVDAGSGSQDVVITCDAAIRMYAVGVWVVDSSQYNFVDLITSKSEGTNDRTVSVTGADGDAIMAGIIVDFNSLSLAGITGGDLVQHILQGGDGGSGGGTSATFGLASSLPETNSAFTITGDSSSLIDTALAVLQIPAGATP